MSETFSQRIKEDIARFVSEPTREGLQDLIHYFGGEFDQYELKESWPLIPRIAKTVLAIANSGGGVIIFGIRDATLDPVGLPEFASKQAVFETFNSYLPSPLMGEITLLDFEYTETTYQPLEGKKIQVLAIPDLPEAIPFVCEDEWHKDDHHIRRGAIYVRSGTNTREATYEQIRALINRRLEALSPQSSTRRVRSELEQIELLHQARRRAKLDLERTDETDTTLVNYLDELIQQKETLLEEALGLE